jgi:MSHA biogenesis protein MshP
MKIISLQRGFTVVSAIFLLVVIAMLGAAAVSLSTSQQQTSAMDVLGARAYQAARSGIEWGAFQVLQSGAINSGNCPVAGASFSVAMPAALSSFGVSVFCRSSSAATEADTTVTLFELTSTAATTGAAVGTPAYAERQISVTIAQ